jgi:hypothetical protein
MRNLQANKRLFEQFSKDSFDSLVKSPRKPSILKTSPSWMNLHGFYEESVVNSESFKRLVDILAGDNELIKMYGIGEIQFILFRLIDKIIELNTDAELHTLEFNQGYFDKVFSFFIQELYEPEWTNVAICPDVRYFRSDLASIDFGDGVVIAGREDDMIKGFMGWNDKDLKFFYDRLEQGGWTSSFVLMVTEKTKKDPDNIRLANSVTTSKKADNLITCMRLFKRGGVAADVLYHSRPSELFKLPGFRITGFVIPGVGSEYVLNSSETEEFKQFRQVVSDFHQNQITTYKHIALALRYFNASFATLNTDDRVIDCITAFEALFKMRDELAFKLSTRVAYLLGASNAEKVSIYTDMKNFYSLRNDIVHGSELNHKDLESLGKVEDLVDYLRRCLRAFISLGRCEPKILTKEFYDLLDNKLIDDDERKNIQKHAGILRIDS